MKTAFLYAGQGTQYTGMGKDFYESFAEFRAVFDNYILPYNLKDMCFKNPQDLLFRTEVAQPCIVAFACGVTELLKDISPDYVCGLSLGEYSALHESGVWDIKTTLEIVTYRGRLMAEASKGIESAMYAILNLSANEIEDCCKKVDGVVSISNYNCPGQIVIGGEKRAVQSVAKLAKQCGASGCIPLAVNGPFHTKYMEPVSIKLREYLSNIKMGDEHIPVIYNFLGDFNKGNDIVDLLAKQVMSSVRMEDSIKCLFDNNVKRFVEIGPGKVLSGFVRKIAKEMEISQFEVINIETVKDLNKLV